MGFPKIRGILLGVRIIRILVYWGLYCSPPTLGNYQICILHVESLCASGFILSIAITYGQYKSMRAETLYMQCLQGLHLSIAYVLKHARIHSYYQISFASVA